MSQLRADAVAACALGRERFAQARAKLATTTFDARFAGLRLRVELAGTAVRDVLAGAFLRAPDDDASEACDLALHIWDGASSGVAWPAPEPDRRDPIVVGQHFASGGVRADGSPRCLVFWEPPWIYGLDLEARVATFYTPDVGELRPWARSQPCLRLLHAWCRALGRIVVHGAVIGRGDRGVLLVGRGGSGKSTLAIAGALAGWCYLGDDYVALAPGEAHAPPTAHALYGIAKLEPDHLARHLPGAAALRIATPSDDGKVLLDLAPRTRRSGVELVAVVVPEVGAACPRLTPIGPGRAMRALAPSSILQLPGWGDDDFPRLAALVRALPAHHLALGSDAGANLAELERLLEPS